ncbi:large ribosomal subunit protein bL36m [Monosporozyma servazzii]
MLQTMSQVRTLTRVARNMSVLSPMRTIMAGYKPAMFTPALNIMSRTITTVSPSVSMLTFTRGFKSKSSLKKFCKDCYIVRRKGRVYVYCKSNGKHKQRQG